jgi:hypothetical protein
MKGHVTVFLVVMLVAVGFLGNLVNAIDSSPLILLLKAQSDCYVSEKNRDSIYGREVVLNVRSCFDGKDHYNNRIYIQFNISALPKDAMILSALLWLYKNPEGANPGLRSLKAFRITNAWNEYTLNWNNQPSVSSRLTASTNVGGALKWYSWDLTQDVRAWHDGSALNYGTMPNSLILRIACCASGSALNYGTMPKDEVEDSRIDYASVFLSREASHPENPFLEIKYAKSLVETATTTEQGSVILQIPKYAGVAVVLSVSIFILAAVAWTHRKEEKAVESASRLSAIQCLALVPCTLMNCDQ